MLTRTPHWKLLLLPLAFVVIATVVGILLFRAFGGSVPLQAEGYRVSVRVPAADAVLANSSVRISGVDVGKVTRVESLGRSARIEMEIEPKFVPLRRGARMTVRTKTLLGEGYVEVAPGPREAEAIPDGGALLASQVQKQQRLDDVLQAFKPETRAGLRRMIRGTDAAFEGRAGDLNATLSATPGLTADLTTFLAALDGQGGQLEQFLGSTTDVMQALGARTEDLDSAVREGARFVSVTGARSEQISRTIDALPTFLTDLRSASSQLGAAAPDITTAVRSLEPTAPLLLPALTAFRDQSGDLTTVLTNLTPTLRTAGPAMPALRTILDAATRSFPTTQLAMRNLLPFIQLSSASRSSFVSTFANTPGTMGGRFQYPGGLIGNYASGTLTAWNEIVGGWVKKLPTNRSNPYPKPRATDEIQSRVGLLSYDCRNVDNPLYLPPFGSAPAGCKTQGPWNFNGKDIYYPRLTLPGKKE